MHLSTRTRRVAKRRIRAAALASALGATAAATLTAHPAAAAAPHPLESCEKWRSVQHYERFQHPGNDKSAVRSNADLLPGDVIRLMASGTTQIATWGAHKGPDGDPTPAENNGRWPAHGVNKYALLIRVLDGVVERRGTAMVPLQWYQAGADSTCLHVVKPPSRIEMVINDDNIGDNNDGPRVDLWQWW